MAIPGRLNARTTVGVQRYPRTACQGCLALLMPPIFGERMEVLDWRSLLPPMELPPLRRS
jgi:hypothetical protein